MSSPIFARVRASHIAGVLIVAVVVAPASRASAQPRPIPTLVAPGKVMVKPRPVVVPARTYATGVTSLTLSSTNLLSNDHLSGTITLNDAAPLGGAVVTVTSTSATIVRPPPTVTVPSGQRSFTFPIYLPQSSSTINATVTASFNATTQTAAVTVRPVVVSSVTIDAATLPGGSTAMATVTLAENAPANGAGFNIGNTNPGALGTPPQVTFAPGQRTGTFVVTAKNVATPTMVTTGFGAPSANINVLPAPPVVVPAPALASVSAPASLRGGAGGTMSFTFASAATGPVHVAYASSDPHVTFPIANFPYAAGTTSSSAAFTTQAVTIPTTVTLTATSGTSTKTATVTLVPPKLVSVTADHVRIGDYETMILHLRGATLTARLDGPCPREGLHYERIGPNGAFLGGDFYCDPGSTVATTLAESAALSGDGTTTFSWRLFNPVTRTFLPAEAPSIVLTASTRTPTSITFSPATLALYPGAPGNVTANVTIDSPAPAGGEVLWAGLSTYGGDGPNGKMPEYITIPQGQTVGQVTVPFTFSGGQQADDQYFSPTFVFAGRTPIQNNTTIVVPRHR